MIPSGLDGRSFEGKATQQNVPISLVELLMHRVFDEVSEVNIDAKVGIRSTLWRQLIVDFENLRNRTRRIVPDYSYSVDIKTDPLVACTLIKEYLNKLQDVGIFKVGQEDVII